MSSYTEARLQLRSLYDRMVEKLGQVMDAFEDAPTAPMHKVNGKTRLAVVRAGSDSGAVTAPGALRVQVRQSSADRGDVELVALPTLPAGKGEPSFVGPVSLPEESSKWTKGKLQRVGLVGGTIAAVAAIAMVVLMPETTSHQAARTQTPTTVRSSDIRSLPVDNFDYSTCESPTQPVSASSTTPAIETPTRRKTSNKRFLRDMDSVMVRRQHEPNLLLTVTEVSDDGEPINKVKESTKPKRIHAVDAKDLHGYGLSLSISDKAQVAFEVVP